MTATNLLAQALRSTCVGEYRCFYCGSPCGDEYPTHTHVKSSFTGRSGVVAPGSRSVCAGCVLSLRESTEITLVDGEVRSGQMMRGYSWVLQPDQARAATKAHLDRLRALCLDPPPPPFAIVLSDSGQTHQLYRGVVNHARNPVTITLEAEPITYRSEDLAARLDLCGRLVAATGKPALKEPVTSRFAIAVMTRYHDGEALLTRWAAVREQPLSRLSLWICGNKELCHGEYPSDIESVTTATGAARH